MRLGKLQKEVKYGFELLSHFYGQATHYLIWSGVGLVWFFFFPLQKYVHLVHISPGLLTAVLERKKKKEWEPYLNLDRGIYLSERGQGKG